MCFLGNFDLMTLTFINQGHTVIEGQDMSDKNTRGLHWLEGLSAFL